MAPTRLIGALTPRRRALAREVMTFLPDVVHLLRAVIADDRVPRQAKVETGLLLAYLVSPIDLVPDFLPVIGQLDDAAVAGLAVRRLLTAAGEPLLRQHWRGSNSGFTVLLRLSEVMGVPGGLLTRLTALGGITSMARRGTRRGQVIEGEVLSRREER